MATGQQPLVSKALGSARWALPLGIFLNCPLLLVYPLVLGHAPRLPLGHVNAGLHAYLTIAWGLQWWSLKKHCEAYHGSKSASAPKKASSAEGRSKVIKSA